MAKARTIYACQQCGAQSPKWLGRCPDCLQWNTYAEETAQASPTAVPSGSKATITLLPDITMDNVRRFSSGIPELDRVLGGGVVPGSFVLLGGDPGIGKSTIVLQATGLLANAKQSVLYITGEESSAQVKMRADRLGLGTCTINILAENAMENIWQEIGTGSYDVIIVDSIQTMYTAKVESAPGTISQVRECAGQWLEYAKSRHTAVFLIGHVTKEGSLAGPKVLEHMVDTVLYFEGERGHPFRILRAVKNRFGGTNEIGVFEMCEVGLREVPNPSHIFLAERPTNVPGSVVTAAQEGTRPVLVEIQALVSSSQLSNPRRTAIGIESARLSLLVAVAEKSLGLRLFDHDIFVNAAGGIRITEPAADLGIILAITSSARNRPISPSMLVVGEVGLAGEVRAVSGIESRLSEAAKLGFTTVVLPKRHGTLTPPPGLTIIPVSSVLSCLDLLS